MTESTLVVGAGRLGHELAKRLQNRNEPVVYSSRTEQAESIRSDE